MMILATNTYADKIEDARRYLISAKKAYKRDPMNPTLPTFLKNAFEKDKNNPEVFLLISVYFFNVDRDVQKALEYMNKFRSIMNKLKDSFGGKYRAEYERIKKFTSVKLHKGDGLSEESYSEIWKVTTQSPPENICIESARKCKSFLDSGNLPQAKEELSLLQRYCPQTTEELQHTAFFLQAKYALLNENLEKAVDLNTKIQSIHQEFSIPFTSFKQDLEDAVRIEAKAILDNSKKKMESEEWLGVQEELNKLLKFRPLLNGYERSEYHYQYAHVYNNLGEKEKAKQEIKAAEEIGYEAHTEKILTFISKLSADHPIGKPVQANKIDSLESQSKKPPFSVIAQDVRKKIREENYEQALRKLESVGNPELLKSNEKTDYQILITKIYIKIMDYPAAAKSVKKLLNLKAGRMSEELQKGFSKSILTYLDNKSIEDAQNDFELLESCLNQSIITPSLRGRAYYLLASTYRGINKRKFEGFKQKASKNQYSDEKLAALTWLDNSVEEPQKEQHHLSSNSKYSTKVFSSESFPFYIEIVSDKDRSLKITEKRRLRFDDKRKELGIARFKKTNENIRLHSATGYEMNFENKNSDNWQLALGVTLVVSALLFIR